MKRTFERGERVLAHGLEARVPARIESGPFRYTDDELEEQKQVREFYGYSTKRMSKSYYLLRHGRNQFMTCGLTAIKEMPKRA